MVLYYFIYFLKWFYKIDIDIFIVYMKKRRFGVVLYFVDGFRINVIEVDFSFIFFLC